jgi:RHS repeat-associated protein
VEYGYFKNGTRQRLTDPDRANTSYTYDAKNRLETVTTAAGLTRYGYFPDDLLREITHPNQVRSSYTYDNAGRVRVIDTRKSGDLVSRFEYGYDANGNRETQLEQHGAEAPESTAYGYDALNRLEGVTLPPEPTFPQGRSVEYGYDRVGNRTSERETNLATADSVLRSYDYDGAHRLRAIQDSVLGPIEFGYDQNGNQTSRSLGDVTTRYVYDPRDKLIEALEDRQVELPGGGTTTETLSLGRFQYDFAGRRNKKIGLEGVRQYVYDGTSLFFEYASGGAGIAKYENGLGLISQTRVDEPVRFASLDALGSITDLTDDQGTARARYRLDPWGNFRFPTDLDQSRNRYAFTGYFFDKELGLYNAKARYFDPKLGRFAQQDNFLGVEELPDTLHRYAYVSNRPTYATDPEGNLAPLLFVPLLIGLIATEGVIIHQEVTEGKELWTTDPRRGVDAGRAATTGAIVAGATAISMLTAGLATPALASAGYGAGTSALVGGAFGNAVGGFAAGTAGGLISGHSLGQSLQMGGYAGATGAIGGVFGHLAGGAVAGAMGGGQAARAVGSFAGGFGGDLVTQGLLVGAGLQDDINYWQAGFSGLMAAGSTYAAQQSLGLSQSRLGRSLTRTLASDIYLEPQSQSTMLGDAALPGAGAVVDVLSRLRLRAPVSGHVLEIPLPARLRNPNISEGERALLTRELFVKLRHLQRAARAGRLEYRPGTMEARIAELQKTYRSAVTSRYASRFGVEPDLRLLDADHPLDLVVKGSSSQRLKMLHRSINRSVGSSLKQAAERLGLAPGDLISDIVIQPHE